MMVLNNIGRVVCSSLAVRTFSRQSSQLLKDSEFLFSPNTALLKQAQYYDGAGALQNVEIEKLETAKSPEINKQCRIGFTRPADSHLKNHVTLKVPGTNTFHHFHKAWLRMQCKCSQCCDPHSGQRIFTPWCSKSGPYQPKYPFASSMDIIGVADPHLVGDDFLAVEFVDLNDGSTHSGMVEKSLLVTLYEENGDSPRKKMSKRPVTFNGPINEIHFDRFYDSDEGLMETLESLVRDGVVILKGAPKRTETIQRCMGKFGPVMETIYGIDFNVKIEHDPINIAYSTEKLDLHMDLIYYESAPGLQGLHTYQFDDSVGGGNSLLLDVFAVAENFRVQYPDLFETLSKVPATFQKIHFKRENPVHMRRCKPHIELDREGEIIAVNWSPPFEGPLLKASPHEIDAYYNAYSRFATEIENSPLVMQFRLQEDDILVFNNRRIVHGRSEIKSDSSFGRQLIGAYVNIDEFYNTYNVTAKKCGINANRSRIGHTDHS